MNSQPSDNPRFVSSDFDHLSSTIKNKGVDQGLDYLEQVFRQKSQYPQLFEVLKMKCRQRLRLPLLANSQTEALDDPIQQQLEDGLIAACHEVGIALVKAGQLEQGWAYLQPVGNRRSIQEVIREFPVTDESREPLIEICLGQGLDPSHGYRILIEHFGVCDAITTFDMQASRFDRVVRRELAEILLRRFYAELCHNLVTIIRREKMILSELAIDATPEEKSLAQLFEDYPALGSNSIHAIDATHLVSVIRIARVVTEPDDLRKGVELCEYGKQLHSDFHYPCPPPFESTFHDHSIYFRALFGENTDQGIAHFERKCEGVDVGQHGGVAYETLIDLLVRVGQRQKAIKIYLEQIWGKFEPLGIAPSVFQIAQTESETNELERQFAKQNDLLSFGICLMQFRNLLESDI